MTPRQEVICRGGPNSETNEGTGWPRRIRDIFGRVVQSRSITEGIR